MASDLNRAMKPLLENFARRKIGQIFRDVDSSGIQIEILDRLALLRLSTLKHVLLWDEQLEMGPAQFAPQCGDI